MNFEWRPAAKMTKQMVATCWSDNLTGTNQSMEAKNEDSLTEAENRRGPDDEESQDKAGEQGVINLNLYTKYQNIFSACNDRGWRGHEGW